MSIGLGATNFQLTPSWLPAVGVETGGGVYFVSLPSCGLWAAPDGAPLSGRLYLGLTSHSYFSIRAPPTVLH